MCPTNENLSNQRKVYKVFFMSTLNLKLYFAVILIQRLYNWYIRSVMKILNDNSSIKILGTSMLNQLNKLKCVQAK